MSDSPQPLSELTESLIELLFTERDQEEARFLLAQIEGEVRSSERIQIAAIKSSNSDTTELAACIDEANRDWRDLLMGAGFGHDVKAHINWAQDQLD
ncbi:MAG: hypothetical protein CMJ35_11085 [Phycisphaerae bacterium]|nr:hypothetical protein [Phycisphaerae bacterium]HCT46785.1 hypothetical protein [Phycisphaerales bacterium]|tara:strand:+ start:379 stop:669 length:291 start_codon:yes stop_codon:yes gene_type:complete